MLDILEQLRLWVTRGDPIAMATVVNTWGSSPRAVGARMAVRDDGSMIGSVSGGCVEGAVVQEALGVLEGGPPRLLQYGVADETAWDVGLACGGSIEIFVQRLNAEVLELIKDSYAERRTLLEAIVVAGPESNVGTTGIFDVGGLVAGAWPGDLLTETETIIAEILNDGNPKRVKIEMEGESLELFMNVFLPPATLILIGGVHISIALSEMAKLLGYRTIVIDPRKSFATAERFPKVDELIQRWPEEGLDEVGIDANTAIAVLTHDPKIDDPALLTALRSPAFYIGALGSRATHAKRVERLRKEGLKSGAMARLKAPIGLDLGGRTPEEIAVSILAEITAARHGKMEKNA
jgi:xanthine dehydrogenase accessory factor